MIPGTAAAVIARVGTLAALSDEPAVLTRRYGTPAMTRVNDLVRAWMAAAGMDVRQDPFGNLIGHYPGEEEDQRTLILGSHLDTVRDAGRFDGVLGVLVALAAVERLHADTIRLPFAVEVIAFADEEGLRFHLPYLGSRALAGTLDPTALLQCDDEGITLADAVRAFGGKPEALLPDPHRAGSYKDREIVSYCEVHIEQGPTLEQQGVPVGVVIAIAGQNRIRVEFEGQSGHAGTTPMDARRDALATASELVLAAESEARACPGAVATVGQLAVFPGASNVIPGQVTLTLDLRHGDDAVLRGLTERVQRHAHGIAARRGVGHRWVAVQTSAPIDCAPPLVDLLGRAVAAAGVQVVHLVSMAGHDAVAVADLTSVAMLFVRCRGGISHHPAEHVEEADVAVAIEVLDRYLRLTADGTDAAAQSAPQRQGGPVGGRR